MREEPIAVAAFGPSLRDTWEEIRRFPYVVSCSGAHRFLVDRAIIPTWHVEVDPRPHKVELVGPPHPNVEYLPASACHPMYFDHLRGFRVRLWHVFSNEEDALRTLPKGEWALMGGPDVGLRAIAIARFFGFRKIHVFGLDGCTRPETGSHADRHPNAPQAVASCEYEGLTYHTTVALLECAKAVFHELDMMPDVQATFHGDGLVQAMAARWTQTPTGRKTILGIIKPELISATVRDLNVRLHRDRPEYGVGGGRHAATVCRLVDTLTSRERPRPSVLDYGCGKGYLAKALPFPIWEYDPAIPDKAEAPRPADLVMCTDVLEHVEPDHLRFVLDDLRRCVKEIGYFTIHTGPAMKSYADGRNTHLIQQGQDWWARTLRPFFHIGKIFSVGPELHVVVGPKAIAKRSAA